MNREAAKLRAQGWIKRGFVLIDTETTGLGSDAEIVQFCAIDHTGRVVLHSLIKPREPIDIAGKAYAVHGLDDKALEFAPSFRRIWPAIHHMMSNRLCIAFNAGFDSRVIDQCAQADEQSAKRPVFGCQWECAMLLYGDYIGVQKWQKLQAACDDLGITLDKAHDALYDCYAALAVIKAIAGPPESWEQTLVEECVERFGGEVVDVKRKPQPPPVEQEPAIDE